MADPQGDVFGVDISVEMIATARESEQRDPLAVRYDVGDVAELPPLDPRFDIAVGVQCLNYAEDIAAMERMCRNIHRSLVPGGEFFVLAHKPDYPFGCPSLDRYGFRCEPTGEEIETGPRARVTALLDPQPISIVTTAPRREVYEECLRATGFSAVEWVPLRVSEAGIVSSARTSGRTSSTSRRWRCCAAAPDRTLTGPRIRFRPAEDLGKARRYVDALDGLVRVSASGARRSGPFRIPAAARANVPCRAMPRGCPSRTRHAAARPAPRPEAGGLHPGDDQ